MKIKKGLVILGLAMASGALIQKYTNEYKQQLDQFLEEYGKKMNLEGKDLEKN